MKNSILDRIICNGGLIGTTAEYFRDNDEISDKFIMECYDQKDTILAREIWGSDLINDIILYREKIKRGIKGV